MKMSKERYELLRSAIVKTAEDAQVFPLPNDFTGTQMSVMWRMFHLVTHDFLYDDDHPAYKAGRVRRFPFIPGFKIYRDNGMELFDEHIRTALKKILKELTTKTDSCTV